MNKSTDIEKASSRMQKVCALFMILLPLGVALIWFNVNQKTPNLDPWISSLPIEPKGPIPFTGIIMGMLAAMLPTGVVIYALARLRGLFGLYAKGSVFEFENVKCYRDLGRAILIWGLFCMLSKTLQVLIITFFTYPPGQRLLVLGVGPNEIGAVFIGVVVIIISRVMEKGRLINKENSLII
ncbi:DUF2975 domain-containing protein [Dethiosulfatarculus sandiegensis]|uniref:DUF2975 domain-containing protein n=1 Tax=Dethiosulfatarculus sandiegensis TaxID=1429043 RepID=A0A0D2HNV2_9BACT|nr:DUF2975 domain-containing protein [Dethiosulfatarculus sandiegensis]KIX12243.1 hypothetical protein X474_19650 [Dethiosulfatarculus sandiegensis]